MRFKKIYVEVTNVCNFSCSFCFKSFRDKRFVSPEDFSATLVRIKPYTDYIYLHVLGEPLLHPQIELLLEIAHKQGFKVNLTTNGSLLRSKREILELGYIRQYNVSLHDAAENVKKENLDSYIDEVLDFASQEAERSYFSLRLWNKGAEDVAMFNRFCLNKINDFFCLDITEKDLLETRNIKLAPHIFLQNAARFSWPGEKELNITNRGCYALKDHIAILSDGTVVPCCLDADASIPLGNILTENLEDILKKERVVNMLNGFRNKVVTEDICRNCGFVV
ncbi:MAG: radical SAM protein [Paludibacteraceae bacterium]|nr:radical SAM protein [Paludibacteraceae bacterium]